ncbi:hypothetical protein ACFL59_15840, partial [Planctomycetota bacterium]
PESLQFTIATPFPGTEYYDALEAGGHLITHDPARFDGFRSAAVRTEALSADDLETIVSRANKSWHTHCKRRARRRA